ncbi:MAG: HPF/RaiA family ribosome-associated protein [Planctomycetia bacterium]|nr:MAG: HPF/RaiA family ribosome-associated protein [Planctomycetia bacterium]
MDFNVFVRGVDNPAVVREMAEGRIAAGLQRFESRVRRATVRLEDETGPNQHGIDKVCSIELLLDSGDVRIREVGSDFSSVIDVAVDRMRAALGRQVSRDKRGIGEG